MFENRVETGDAAREQAYLITHQDEILKFDPSPLFISSIQAQMASFGVLAQSESLLRQFTLTQSEKEHGIFMLQSLGIAKFYRTVVQAVSLNTLGTNISGLPTKYSTHEGAHLQRICQLDHISCMMIAYGTLFGTITANPGGVVLAVWGIACCTS